MYDEVLTCATVRNTGLKPHPARYPSDLPEYFIRMLTDKGYLVADPFAGSCVTGEVCEKLGLCIDTEEEYLLGALGRFKENSAKAKETRRKPGKQEAHYKIPRPGLLWNGKPEEPLVEDGGRTRPEIIKQDIKEEETVSCPTPQQQSLPFAASAEIENA
ncbi:MAG: site-specific DNA-methyltransferase [Desulfobacteraceae bacterium]|nr:site-specific DNA-methyltransferase [Desulfobacteraceae bacterium]